MQTIPKYLPLYKAQLIVKSKLKQQSNFHLCKRLEKQGHKVKRRLNRKA